MNKDPDNERNTSGAGRPGDGASREGGAPREGGASREGGADARHGEAPGGDTGADGDLDLRRLLLTAVQDLEPSDDALDHLRKAVPERRARKRQALVGVAAAVLLLGTAVPAFLHVADAADGSGHRTVTAGRDESAPPRTRPDGGRSFDAGQAGGSDPGARTPGRGSADAHPKPHGSAASRGSGAGAGGGSSPMTTFGVKLPNCAADQLGVTATKSRPTADGTVYGSFHVANVSNRKCAVDGGDSVGFAASGAADPAKITVVQHTPGDPATQLPETSNDTAPVALAPDAAYELKFAFVPSETCPSSGDSPDPTPSGDPSKDPQSPGGSPGSKTDAAADTGTGSDAGAGGSGLGTQLLADGGDGTGGGTQEGSVSVSHVPEPGADKAQTTIQNACAGTIYKTGPVNEPAA
ncbi:hypothetical protein [Streptomyces sp. NRRL F-5126]|uniref:hypothetical protein n=1 Tax=Streptomyces sp. NRRL F-5126 TaxID=1463857 RepID=UPI0006914468|nr:hypothetical protein [Streptomyces sp. NRRL F-5126]